MTSRILRIVLVGLITFGAFYLPSLSTVEVSAQAAQDFVLVNATDVEIHALYVSPHSVNEWGEDILEEDTMGAGEAFDITFSRKERAKFWDLRVEDSEGNYIVWEKLNLLEISKVTLYYKNGKATAVVE